MASRLTLKKGKKYHPPIDDSGQEKKNDDDKTNKNPMMNLTNTDKSRTYADIAKCSSKPTEPKTKSCFGIGNIPQDKRDKTYAQMSRDYTNTNFEDDIFRKAKASAQKHNIKLEAGLKDKGFGNCAFESVINNINERSCFQQKLKQTPNWYRRIWMNNMMRRIIEGRCLWNLGFTENEIR